MKNNVISFPVAPCSAVETPDKHKGARDVNAQELAARLAYQRAKLLSTPNIHGVHVGDLFYQSIGYNMTLISFFQVVGLRGKCTALLRPIAARNIAGCGYEGELAPVRDAFLNDREPVARRTSRGYNGKPVIGSPEYKDRKIYYTTDNATHYFNSMD